MHITSYSLIG